MSTQKNKEVKATTVEPVVAETSQGEVTQETQAQDAASTQGTLVLETVSHIVTELDLQHNPDLVEKGIKVGDEVQIPEEAKAISDAREVEAKAKQDAAATQGDTYTVIHPFADRDNFGKTWQVGDDVSHFDKTRLDSCIERELVKKA